MKKLLAWYSNTKIMGIFSDKQLLGYKLKKTWIIGPVLINNQSTIKAIFLDSKNCSNYKLRYIQDRRQRLEAELYNYNIFLRTLKIKQ